MAPSTIKSIAEMFDRASSKRPDCAVRFVDGSIIGGPPSLTSPDAAGASSSSFSSSSTQDTTDVLSSWKRPSIPTSGPHAISSIPVFGAQLSAALNMRHISPEIGAASGLKMCFASLSKGFTALAIQSFTTASKLGVLDELTAELGTYYPASLKTARGGLTGMPPKAYRWVREMEEISKTFTEEGGFDTARHDVFGAVAEIYKSVAEETVLGQEKVSKRKRGQDVEDVAKAMAEGLEKKKKKND